MYEYIKGKITDINSTYITLENNNIGYAIYTGNPYYYQLDKEYKVYIYTQIKEDEHLLFGFKDQNEKDLFLKLISVKGLGPKMAMPILATGSITNIEQAIEKEDINYLKKFPKIGDKVARQIILDLKGKLAKQDQTNINNSQELILVLENLGYKNNDIKKVIPSVNTNNTLEEQIKEALKLMLK
ncbi:MAG: Holliday junction branch migration protein RuvA [Bacilli bacterium]|jgi:Holliday junction DNA helicase RuvA